MKNGQRTTDNRATKTKNGTAEPVPCAVCGMPLGPVYMYSTLGGPPVHIDYYAPALVRGEREGQR